MIEPSLISANGGPDLAIQILIWTFRALAGALSGLAFVGLVRQWRGIESPIHDRRRNDIAWAWTHAGQIIAALSFIGLRIGSYAPDERSILGDLVVAVVWMCFASGAAVRMAAKVPNPRAIYVGSAIFLVGGAGITLTKALVL